MAVISNFKNFVKESDLANVFSDALVCPAGNKYMILGLDICNIENTGITVNVKIYKSSLASSFYLVKDAPIPVGSTIQVITSQKHILEENDKIEISSSVDNAAHLVGSYMECILPD